MKTYHSAQALGLFDVELLVQWLVAKGNPLSRLDAALDWEGSLKFNGRSVVVLP